MNKSLLQKKFRFVMIIAALALFITIFTPTYIIYGKNTGNCPRVLWMWTILFGAGGGKLNTTFNFNWFAFIGYAMTIILLIVCLTRKFISLDSDDKKNNKNGFIVDTICMFCCLISLIMFIILPFSITNGMSTEPAGEIAIKTYYGWGISYILAYIILAVMFVSSVIVLFAETIIKFKKIKEKKANKKEVGNNKE